MQKSYSTLDFYHYCFFFSFFNTNLSQVRKWGKNAVIHLIMKQLINLWYRKTIKKTELYQYCRYSISRFILYALYPDLMCLIYIFTLSISAEFQPRIKNYLWKVFYSYHRHSAARTCMHLSAEQRHCSFLSYRGDWHCLMSSSSGNLIHPRRHTANLTKQWRWKP